MDRKKILRVLDVNFNRSKEAMRVVEDICRFVYENDELRKKARLMRHALDKLAKNKMFKDALSSRDSELDLGRKTDVLELSRKNVNDILYANLQRAKESLRVLEEFLKIISPSSVKLLKKIRYNTYSLEKKITSLRKVKNA